MDSPGLNNNRDSRITERRRAVAVAVLCLSGAAAGGTLLYRDYHIAGEAGVGKPVARVVRRQAKVRRKPSSSFVWTQVRQDEDLYRKDSVQTSGESAATLRFGDGSLLEIGENSLVVIDDIQNLSLNFLKGSAVVQRKGGGNARISVGEDGKTRVEELPVRLVSPEPQASAFVLAGRERQVRFTWEPRQPGSYVFQISTSPAFNRDVRSLEAGGPGSREAVLSLSKGHYFWRVTQKLGAREAPRPEVRRMTIANLGTLTPVSPGSGESVRVFGDSGPVGFSFSDPSESDEESALASEKSYSIEIARDPGFKSIIAHQRVSPEGGLASVAGLPSGRLYWRLRAEAGDLSAVSEAAEFKVSHAQKPSVELVRPVEGATVEGESQVYFSWKSDAPELSSLVEVEKPDGSKAYSSDVRGMGTEWKRAPSGNYRWRVSVLERGQTVAQSPWREMRVTQGRALALEVPAKGQKILYWEDPEKFEFRWRPDPMIEADSGTRYRLEVSANGFQGVQASAETRATFLSSDELKLASGNLQWRVSVIDGGGRRIKQSDPREFAYGVKPRLPAPQPVAPKVRSRVNLLSLAKERRIRIDWSPVPDAREYELTVYRASKRGAPDTQGRDPAADVSSKGYQLVSRSKTREPFALLEKLRPGRYFWTVRAVDPLSRSGAAMEYAEFTADYGDPLEAPEILSPEVQ